MRTWTYVLSAVGLVVACSSAGPSEEEKTGSLSLALTATDSSGELYRLRSASFAIYGYPQYYFPSSSPGASGAGGSGDEGYYYSETVTSESDPNAAVITRRVVPGSYYVTFDTSRPWYIEHVTASGAERVSQSVLLSTPTQYAYVYDRGSSSVFYQFGVDGKTIDFRHGDINIRIGIEHPNNGAGGQAGAAGAPGAAGAIVGGAGF
jgi:hypothetical protein